MFYADLNNLLYQLLSYHIMSFPVIVEVWILLIRLWYWCLIRLVLTFSACFRKEGLMLLCVDHSMWKRFF